MAKTMTVVASYMYSGLYEEGDVEHINCVWPVSLTLQLMLSSIIRFIVFGPPIRPLTMCLYKAPHTPFPLAFD